MVPSAPIPPFSPYNHISEPMILENVYDRTKIAILKIVESQSGIYSIEADVYKCIRQRGDVLDRLSRSIPRQDFLSHERRCRNIQVELYSSRGVSRSTPRDLSLERVNQLFKLFKDQEAFYDDDGLNININCIEFYDEKPSGHSRVSHDSTQKRYSR